MKLEVQKSSDTDEDGVSQEFKQKVAQWEKNGIFDQICNEIKKAVEGQKH